MSLISFLKKPKAERKYLLRKKFFPSLINNKIFINYLKSKQLSVGEGTYFFDPQNTTIDIQRPWGLSIGEYCKISSGVVILAHDYSRSVLRMRYSKILCEFKETIIGNNVFIGINSIILMGTVLGNNVIVGAGSVVSGHFPDDVVIAGNPARVICSLDDFLIKRESCQIAEAKNYIRLFEKKFGRSPRIDEMDSFFTLFLKRDEEELTKNNVWYKWNGDKSKEILDSFLSSKQVFDSFDELLASSFESDEF